MDTETMMRLAVSYWIEALKYSLFVSALLVVAFNVWRLFKPARPKESTWNPRSRW